MKKDIVLVDVDAGQAFINGIFDLIDKYQIPEFAVIGTLEKIKFDIMWSMNRKTEEED